MNADSMNMGSMENEKNQKPRSIYVPRIPQNTAFRPPYPNYEQQHKVGLRYGQAVHAGDPLLLVMSCPAHLTVARELSEDAGCDIVIWAWLCSEVLARQAETEFPVVYGIPTAEQVAETAEAGPQENADTSICLNVESVFNVPEILPHI